MTDIGSMIISIFALIFSVIAFLVARHQKNRLATSARLLEASIFFADRNSGFEQRLADWPEVSEFYGVDLNCMKADGLSLEQVVYLVLSTNALIGTCKSRNTTIFDYIQSSSYRRLMYSHLKTRKAWKYARRLFSSEYREGIDRYMTEVYGESFESLDA